MDAITEFKATMCARGLTPPEIIEPGKLHRFATNGRARDDAGWCKLFNDGLGGVFGDFRTGLSETWQAQREKPFTQAEREAFKRRCEHERLERETEQTQRHAEARDKARSVWKAATPARADHPYLTRKAVAPVDTLREIPAGEAAEVLGYTPKSGDEPLTGRLLIVPVKAGGELSTVEMIDEAGRKAALYGGAKAGGYWAAQPLPDGDGTGLTILIGEGVATVLSAREATGHPVIAALSCGNIEPAAKAMRARYPKAVIVILADLVKATGEPDPHAAEAARAVGGRVAIPDFGENRIEGASDFNDLCRLRGAEAVQRAIAGAKAPGRGKRGDSKDNATAGVSDGEDGGDANTCHSSVEPPHTYIYEEERLRAVEVYDAEADRKRSQADILIDIGRKVSAELFCGDDDRAYAIIQDTREVWPIAFKQYRQWLRECYYKLVEKGANSNSIKDAIDTIEATARSRRDVRPVFLRTARHNDKVYLDLCDDKWRVVEVDANGWRILDQSPVMFTRRSASAPFPEPERGGSLSELWPILNVPVEVRPLVACWLVAALWPKGPYTVLGVQGWSGAAKSSVATMLRLLCDPSKMPTRSVPKDEDGFKAICAGAWCICIDNLSGIQPWLSDSLCRANSGVGFGGRKLYTDLEEETIKVCRPIILTGIEPLAVRGDLAQRTITMNLVPITEDHRLTEEELAARFEKIRPRIFGVLLGALSQAVRVLPTMPKQPLPRMADFAKVAISCETALGLKAGEFMRAYRGNIEGAAAATVEGSAVAQALIEFVDIRGDWTGTATELLNLIGPKDDDHSRAAKEWPKNGRGMVGALDRLGPDLLRLGIHYKHHERLGHERTRRLRVWKVPAQPSAPSAPSAGSPEPRRNAGSGGDGPADGRADGRADGPTTVRKPSAVNTNKNNDETDADDADGLAATFHTSSPPLDTGAGPVIVEAEV